MKRTKIFYNKFVQFNKHTNSTKRSYYQTNLLTGSQRNTDWIQLYTKNFSVKFYPVERAHTHSYQMLNVKSPCINRTVFNICTIPHSNMCESRIKWIQRAMEENGEVECTKRAREWNNVIANKMSFRNQRKRNSVKMWEQEFIITQLQSLHYKISGLVFYAPSKFLF